MNWQKKWGKEDQTLIDVLYNIRVGQSLNDSKVQVQQRKVNIKNWPPAATFIYAENKPKDDYNTSKLIRLNYSEAKLKATHVFPETMPLDFQTSLSSKFTVGLILSLGAV